MSFSQSWRIFVATLKLSYDHIGKVMLSNLIWFGIGFAPMLAFSYLPFLQSGLSLVVAILASFITMGGALGAVHYQMNLVVCKKETNLKDMWEGFKRYWLKGGIIFALGVLGLLILLFNIWFSQSYPPIVFMILSGLWIWAIIFWFALHQFVFPFLINQNISVFMALKRAALIILDNPGSTLILLILSAIIMALSLLLAAPILIFTASFLALIQNNYYHKLMAKYEIEVEAEVEGEDKSE